ncbi:hypothetical protein K1T71_004925 [Dendrolimus kikuchii]|uniref:Uncharacterized protein n=1 Tax=Dendrolimus kikuchii TaxID=765133 RepID=A0ACC1D5K7_9NEOP|nr:hypothetical protein K1T71_004925 [Dendrolimus kikuchii]
MEPLMTQEESYAERRQLFKNIWDTAMNIDEKDFDIINKPKVIKTLRLDEVDKCVIGKKKKQRIRNLRTVCNKILDFCDRQDADDMFYEKIVAEGQEPIQHKLQLKSKKLKRTRMKKKMNKAKSLFSPLGDLVESKKENEKNNDFPNLTSKASQDRAFLKLKCTSVKKSVTKSSSRNQKLTALENLIGTSSASGNRSKVIKKKSNKRKKPSVSEQLPGTLDWPV